MTWLTVSVFVFFTIIVGNATINARAIQQNAPDQLVDDFTIENDEMLVTLANYRHRFEHSNSMKTLRWMFEQHNNADDILCKMCHILLPMVRATSSFLNFPISFFFVYQFRILIELNQTDRIENITLEVCNEFGLVLDVCSGAVYEYKVNHLFYVHLNTASTLTKRMWFFMSLPSRNTAIRHYVQLLLNVIQEPIILP